MHSPFTGSELCANGLPLDFQTVNNRCCLEVIGRHRPTGADFQSRAVARNSLQNIGGQGQFKPRIVAVEQQHRTRCQLPRRSENDVLMSTISQRAQGVASGLPLPNTLVGWQLNPQMVQSEKPRSIGRVQPDL